MKEYINIGPIHISVRNIFLWIFIVFIELVIVWIYFLLSSSQPTDLRYLAYPFIWINTSVWVVYKTEHISSENKYITVLVLFISIFYFLVLLYIPGLIGFSTQKSTEGLYLSIVTPGWGPIISYTGNLIQFTIIPFQVIGYLSISYLIYISLLNTTKSSIVGGLLGLFTCVGCVTPIFASLLGFLGGGLTSLTTSAYSFSYDIGTIIFLITIWLLYITSNNKYRIIKNTIKTYSQ